MSYPLVSVICLCYNHERFLAEALDSVLNQTYPNIEIIVADDASTDNSVAIITDYLARFPQLKVIFNNLNMGICRAFNQALSLATGEYIIDFATDDILMPDRIAEQVECFAKLGEDYGAVYTDALLIDEQSRRLGNFYKRDKAGTLLSFTASGDIYASALERYFICTPTLMFRKIVYDQLHGYDETLAYEDFDFIVRSAREFKFFFLDKILVKRRLHPNSLSAGWYKKGDKQLFSTIRVCWKALGLNRNNREKQALIRRVEWELKQACFTQNFAEADELIFLLKKLKPISGRNRIFQLLVHTKVNLSFIHRLYHWFVNRKH